MHQPRLQVMAVSNSNSASLGPTRTPASPRQQTAQLLLPATQSSSSPTRRLLRRQQPQQRILRMVKRPKPLVQSLMRMMTEIRNSNAAEKVLVKIRQTKMISKPLREKRATLEMCSVMRLSSLSRSGTPSLSKLRALSVKQTRCMRSSKVDPNFPNLSASTSEFARLMTGSVSWISH